MKHIKNSFGFYRAWFINGMPGSRIVDFFFRTKKNIAEQLVSGETFFDVCLEFDRSDYPYPRPVHPFFGYYFYDWNSELTQGWFEEFCNTLKYFNQLCEITCKEVPEITLRIFLRNPDGDNQKTGLDYFLSVSCDYMKELGLNNLKIVVMD